MMNRIGTSRPLCWTTVRLLIYILLASAYAQTNTFQQSTVGCPSGGGVTGYTTIQAMNNDMTTELNKIKAGKSPQPPYVFVVCPSTNVDASAVTLMPTLSGAVFTCGIEGNLSSNCFFVGGANQVLIDNPVNISNYKLSMVNFMGITFTGFTNAAITGNAGSNTTVTLSHVNFENFTAMFAVQQQNNAGKQPFKVQVLGSTISGAMGGVAFSNVGGLLTLQDVSVESSTLISLASTGSISSFEQGSTFLRRVTVTNSNIASIFVSLDGASLDAMGVNIESMMNMMTIFDVGGQGTYAMIEDLVVTNNDLTQVAPPVRWTCLNIRQSAMARVVNATIVNNTNIRHVFSVADFSTLDINRAIIMMASGGLSVNPVDVSAVIFANIRSKISASRVEMDKIQQFTTSIFGNGASHLDTAFSCLGTGSGQGAVYMDASSTYTSNSNFIDPSFVSSVCPVQGMRLIQEQKGSGCFQANRADCSFGCMPFFDANSCLAQASLPPSSVPSTMTKTTKTPSLSPAMPSGVPSTSPSQKPVSQKPVSQKPVVSQRPVSQKPVSQKPVSLTGVPSLPPNTTMPTYQPQTTAPSPGSVTLPPINTAPPAEHVPSTAPTDALYGWLRKPSSYPANKQTLRPAGTPSPTIAPSSKPLCNCSKGSKGGKSKNKKKKGKRRTLQGYVYNFNAADNDYNGDDNYVRNDNYYCRCPSSQGKKGSKGTKGSKGKKGRKASSSKNSHNNAHDSWVTNALYFWTGE